MSEHCKDLNLNDLYLVSLSFKYKLLDKSELEEAVNEENSLSDVPLSPRSFGHLLQQWQKVREEICLILNHEVLCEANLLTKRLLELSHN